MLLLKRASYSTCITLWNSRLLFATQSFSDNCVGLGFLQKFKYNLKCQASGYTELEGGKLVFMRSWNLGLIVIYFVSYHSLWYVSLDDNCRVIKSRWPFIGTGEDFLQYTGMPDKVKRIIKHDKGGVIAASVNNVQSRIGFLPFEGGTTLIDVSPIINPESFRLQTLGSVVNRVAHDFNNLLTGIVGFCELLLEKQPRSREAKEIARNAEKARQLVDQILNWAKNKDNSPVIISPYRALMQMQCFLRCVIGNTARLTISGSSKLSVRISPVAFEQIVTNLVVNARDAIAGTGGLIQINLMEGHVGAIRWARGTIKAGTYVMVSVLDTGSGVPEHLQNKIFENSYSTKQSGTGQGLAIVADLLSEADGFIVNIPCTEGAGAFFRLGLPVATDGPIKERPRKIKQEILQSTILIVEDDPSVRAVVYSALKRGGHKVMCATGMVDAVVKLQKHRPKLVLADSDLGDGDGLGLIELEETYGHRTLIVSGYSQEEIEQKVGQKFAFLPKPFTLRQLEDKVQAMLNGVE